MFILSYLFWPLLIIGLIAFRWRRQANHPSSDKEWYLQFALSKEDSVSQCFLLISVFFLGVTLLTLNRDMGDPFSWQTILFVTSAVAIVIAYWLKTIYTLAFGLIGATAWWAAQAVEWMQGKHIKISAIIAALLFLALVFYFIGRLHEKEMKWKRFALVYLVLGIISVTGALFFLSTKLGISALGEIIKGDPFYGSWQLSASLLIFFTAVIGTGFYGALKERISIAEFAAVALLTLLFGTLAFLPAQSMFVQTGTSYGYYYGDQSLSASGIMWAMIFNIVVFLEILGLIFSGYARRETWLINMGALFLFLLIAVKYFDWFFTFLDKSIFFIGAGILLFGLGWSMEKGRHYMLSHLKEERHYTLLPQ